MQTTSRTTTTNTLHFSTILFLPFYIINDFEIVVLGWSASSLNTKDRRNWWSRIRGWRNRSNWRKSWIIRRRGEGEVEKRISLYEHLSHWKKRGNDIRCQRPASNLTQPLYRPQCISLNLFQPLSTSSQHPFPWWCYSIPCLVVVTIIIIVFFSLRLLLKVIVPWSQRYSSYVSWCQFLNMIYAIVFFFLIIKSIKLLWERWWKRRNGKEKWIQD